MTQMLMLQPASWMAPIDRIGARWSALNLAAQFALAALLVLGCGMTVLGMWVTSRIEKGVLEYTAVGVATHINSIVEPHLRFVGGSASLRPGSEQAIEALLQSAPLGHKLNGLGVLTVDGVMMYSDRREMIGRRFPTGDRFAAALRGEVSAEFNALGKRLGSQPGADQPLLEIYSPITVPGSSTVIAVAKFYEDASSLQAELRNVRLQSWYVVALVTLAMLSILFGIVRNGSETISNQQRALRDRIAELSASLAQNEVLRTRIDEIHRRSVETNDLVLRRIGLELHDGPAQLISLALLRLDALRPKSKPTASDVPMDDLERIRSALVDSLAEIRNMSAGLTLPELDAITPSEALAQAARIHERRTSTPVSVHVDALPPHLSNALKACLYRFAQEALNNAFRHGGGKGQSLLGACQDDVLKVVVSDAGPGFMANGNSRKDENRLGLTGMRDRVASLGGTLDVQSEPGRGTQLTAQFKLAPVGGTEHVGESHG
jgi:signal transduction histidine kinase